MPFPDIARFDPIAHHIMRRAPTILRQHKLEPEFAAWRLTNDGGLTVLFAKLSRERISQAAVVGNRKVAYLDYHDQNVIHDLSTAVGGLEVIPCNSTGLGYAFILATGGTLRLPERAPFPGIERGKLLLGLAPGERPVRVGWNDHLMLGGMTGSGKSTGLRLIVYQALQEGYRLALCDVGARTFPMLKGHPALLTGVATEPAQAVGFAESVLTEIARREQLYDAAPDYPDDLDEYNAAAARSGLERLARLLVVFDEYTDLVVATGGAKGKFSQLAARIALGARKWGVTLVFAGHQFQRDTSGLIREQCSTRLCFKVEDHTTASIVVGTAEPTGLSTPGRAILHGEGRIQTFHLDKQVLVGVAQTFGPSLTAEERRLAAGLLTRGGLVSVDNLTALGLGPRPAERLVQEWDARGWSAKDPLRKNGRYLTPALLALLRSAGAETAEAVEPVETWQKRAETAQKLEA